VRRSITRLIIMSSASLSVIAAGDRFEAAEHGRAPKYRVDVLRSLGGTNDRGSSVTDWGLVAGYSNLRGDQAREATLWFHGWRLPLGTLGGPNSNVVWPGQNETGLVVGIAQTNILQPRGETWSCRSFFPGPDNTKYTCLGFVWEWGRMRRLDTLGGDNGYAASANNLRQVVGWAETKVLDDSCDQIQQVLGFRGVRWDLNTNRMHELLPYGDDSASAATAINDRGQIVGISGDCDQAVGRHSARHAVLWDRGTVKVIDTLGGTTWNTPTAINERGDMIIGFASQPGDNPDAPRLRAFLWTTRDGLCPPRPGTRTCDLGTLPGHATSQAWGLNDRGQIVGQSCPATGFCKAFIWENGAMRDLNDPELSRFSDQLEHAQDINDLGQITGRAVNLDTEARTAFLATPIGRR
jgi:probable HAF family extracellular repeat protein